MTDSGAIIPWNCPRMMYYNSLVAEKLTTIMEIQRLNKLIDQNRAINSDSTELRTKIDQLKSRLESLNAEILSYKISESNKAPVDLKDIFRRDEAPGLESEGLENSGPDDINEPGFTPVE